MAKETAAPQEGDAAPEILLETDTGEMFRLSSLKGRNVVLYFYPRADTPGCTVESCELRDVSGTVRKLDAVIVGVSPDPMSAQAKFKTKYGLPFQLLCDVKKTAAQAYGVWKEKIMYGKTVMGIERTTFLIGKDGRIARIFRKVKPQGHGEQVREALSVL
jgi:peroxiredoxin Q/BCP